MRTGTNKYLPGIRWKTTLKGNMLLQTTKASMASGNKAR